MQPNMKTGEDILRSIISLLNEAAVLSTALYERAIILADVGTISNYSVLHGEIIKAAHTGTFILAIEKAPLPAEEIRKKYVASIAGLAEVEFNYKY